MMNCMFLSEWKPALDVFVTALVPETSPSLADASDAPALLETLKGIVTVNGIRAPKLIEYMESLPSYVHLEMLAIFLKLTVDGVMGTQSKILPEVLFPDTEKVRTFLDGAHQKVKTFFDTHKVLTPLVATSSASAPASASDASYTTTAGPTTLGEAVVQEGDDDDACKKVTFDAC